MDLRRREFAALMLGGAAALSLAGRASAEDDPLPSWNAGPAKDAIVKFVHSTTDAASPSFVPLAERIATFDQDGTLWVEHPIYTQLVYCFDRVRKRDVTAAGHYAAIACEPGVVHFQGSSSSIFVFG